MADFDFDIGMGQHRDIGGRDEIKKQLISDRKSVFGKVLMPKAPAPGTSLFSFCGLSFSRVYYTSVCFAGTPAKNYSLLLCANRVQQRPLAAHTCHSHRCQILLGRYKVPHNIFHKNQYGRIVQTDSQKAIAECGGGRITIRSCTSATMDSSAAMPRIQKSRSPLQPQVGCGFQSSGWVQILRHVSHSHRHFICISPAEFRGRLISIR